MRPKHTISKQLLSSLFIAVSAAISVSGQAGENITYTGDSDQLKSIKGKPSSLGPSPESVSNNTVTIDISQGGTGIVGSIFGGYNPDGSDVNITDNITDNIINYLSNSSPSSNSDIFGGYSDAMGAVNNNQVVISADYNDGDNNKITGGFSIGGRVSDNQVTIEAGESSPSFLIKSDISGGESLTGKVDNNQVTLSDGEGRVEIEGDISGGIVSTDGQGNVTHNQVTLSGGEGDLNISGDISGGIVSTKAQGNVTHNQITLSGGEGNVTIDGDIAGGVVSANGQGDVIQNQVILSGGEGNMRISGDIWGGRSLHKCARQCYT